MSAAPSQEPAPTPEELQVADAHVIHVTTGGTKRTFHRRPFHDWSRTLDTVLLDDFALPGLRWLFGLPHGSAPSQAVNAYAEVALAVLGALGFLHLRPDETSLADATAAAVEWLSKQGSYHPDGSCCWDHSAWDTAAVSRALREASCRTDLLGRVEPSAQQVTSTAYDGLAWLLHRWVSSESGEASSALNPAECAAIGRCLADFIADEPVRTGEVCRDAVGRSPVEVLTDICEYLLRRQSEKMIEVKTDERTTEIATIWWGDFFGTSEVLHLFLAVNNASGSGHLNIPPPLAPLIRESVAKCLLLIENSHFDGLWGGYLDTVALLGAYVEVGACRDGLFKGATHAEGLATQGRIIFRVLRWMCDPTQRSSDGSVLHTAFLTTFFALTIISVATRWRYASDPIPVVYDEMSLLMETGVSEFRVAQLRAIIARDEALAERDASKRRERNAERRRLREVWIRGRAIATVATVAIAVSFIAGLSLVEGWVTTELAGGHLSDLLSLIGVIATVVVAIVTILWTVGTPEVPTDSE